MGILCNHKDAKGWRGKPFPLYAKFAKIWGKDCANGRAARTPNDMAINANEEGLYGNEFGMSFSPLSPNQIEIDHFMNQNESQTIGKKRKRSKDLVDSTFENFVGVFKMLWRGQMKM